MQFFTKDFSSFFRELASNNNGRRFGTNRQRNGGSVKEPVSRFAGEVRGQVQRIDPEVKTGSGEAITGIDKTRFPKNKIPYNTRVGPVISPAGNKNESMPGRRFPGALVKFHRGEAFRIYFENVKGRRSKRMEPSLAIAARIKPFAANKRFYFNAELKPSLLNQEELADIVLAFYRQGENRISSLTTQ